MLAETAAAAVVVTVAAKDYEGRSVNKLQNNVILLVF